ncbi:MAG: bifunctional folylpolyglutamate synthase/dihydrofolate synthase [Planctomycetaceae bacterium]|jgi:dihydrofolate synthase/folylpolyglutamate synthase|nr:bifunctional folylpolyglutamate synthase/dihydrofolate synthase [Planctomycetaceae bacterium]
MTFQEAVDFFYKRVNYENFVQIPYQELAKNLEKLRRFLEECQSPDRSYPVIHVAGTKGKGSVCAIIDRIFTCAGYRVGRFTSPHLNNIRERFTIGNVPCTEAEFAELAGELADKLRKKQADGFTFFELTTLLAFEYFARQKVDLAVMETGLGGRFDATNICRPDLTVITSISLEHTEQLGHDLASIAGEKAGIIKQGIPLISGVCEPEPAEVIRETAHRLKAPLYEFGKAFHLSPQPDFRFDYQFSGLDDGFHSVSGSDRSTGADGNRNQTLKQLSLRLLGRHQQQNAAAALTAANLFRGKGWHISETSVRSALQTVSVPARIEAVAEHPLVILDGAHNPASVAVLLETLLEHFPRQSAAQSWRLLFGTNRDKEVGTMLPMLLPYFDETVFTQAHSTARAVPAEELREFFPAAKIFQKPETGIADLIRRSGTDDLICVTGSLYLAAEVRAFLLQ